MSYFRNAVADYATNGSLHPQANRLVPRPDGLPNPRQPERPNDLWSQALARPASVQELLSADASASRGVPMTRRYELSYLAGDGSITQAMRLAPAIPAFEEAFSALARGTVIATADGPVAVEDLVPGMIALTAEGRAEPIDWIGAMTIYPAAALPGIAPTTLTRITAEAFGLGRPVPDLVLGPRARLLLRDARARAVTGGVAAYAPARSFADGVSIIEVTPAAPVTVYHLVLRRQGSLRAAGLEIESFHPGNTAEALGDPHMAGLFLSLFPHLRSFTDFGSPAHPRMSADQVDAALMG